MAFSVLMSPAQIQPVGNRLLFRVFDDLWNQPNFKYTFELEIGAEVVSTSIIFPRPDGSAIYDASRTLRDHIETEFINNINNFYYTDEAIEYTLKVYVEHETLTKTLRTTLDRDVWWGVAQNWSDALALDSFYNKFLPNINEAGSLLGPKLYPQDTGDIMAPFTKDLEKGIKEYPIRPNERRTVTAVVRDSSYASDITRIQVVTTPYGDPTPHKYFTITFAPSAISEPKYNFLNIPVGIAGVNLMMISNPGLTYSVPPATNPWIDPNEDETYWIFFTLTNPLGFLKPYLKPIGFKIDKCNPSNIDKKYSVLYKTAAGGWWAIPFTLKSFEKVNIDRTTRDSVLPWDYDITSRQEKSLYINSKGSWVLNTNWLEYQEQIDEVIDMLASPEVFLTWEEGSISKYIPVHPKSGEYDVYKERQDRGIRYEIEFIEAFNKNNLV